ncbi:hypothetical protein CCACVL1_00142, partial [Corchorus capsularis]
PIRGKLERPKKWRRFVGNGDSDDPRHPEI